MPAREKAATAKGPRGRVVREEQVVAGGDDAVLETMSRSCQERTRGWFGYRSSSTGVSNTSASFARKRDPPISMKKRSQPSRRYSNAASVRVCLKAYGS